MNQNLILRYLVTTAILVFVSTTIYGQDDPTDQRIIIKEISLDKNYGFKPKNNIKVGSVRNEYAYIAQLTGPNGEEITARRIGSGWPVKSKNAPFGKAQLDKWEITYEGLDKPIFIYLNGYEFEEPKCPMGLNFKKL